MATLARDAFNIAMAWMGQIDKNGNIDDADYEKPAPKIMTALQRELVNLGVGDYYKTFEFDNKPITNALGYISNFNITEFTGTELMYECNSPAKAYYFEVDDNCTVYVEDYTSAWNVKATITGTGNGTANLRTFKAFTGLITPTSGATRSRLRFTGTDFFRTINRALFNVPFAIVADIPIYQPWYPVTMPADFKSIDQIINEYPERQYSKDSAYKWEGRDTLKANYYYEGKIRIVYKPVPTIITDLDTDYLVLDDIVATTVLPYGLAALLNVANGGTKGQYFEDKYNEMKSRFTMKSPAGEQTIVDFYKVTSGMG